MIPIIVSCPRGFEELVKQEITNITNKKATTKAGLAQFDGDWEDVYQLNIHSRLASRVLVELVQGNVHSETSLYQLTKKIVWHDWFTLDKTFRVRVEGKATWCKRFDFLALKIKDAVCDCFTEKFQQRPNVEKHTPDIRISAYINEHKATLYLDTSGEALFKRGWRKETDIAPIRENLAAGLLKFMHYDGSQTFIDPMCGSGTIAIEAALIAANIPPGINRKFAFQHFTNFNSERFNYFLALSKQKICTPNNLIISSDKQIKAIEKTKYNAQSANISDYLQINCQNFEDLKVTSPSGIMLSNPPYGQRLSEIQNIQSNYPIWSKVLKQQFPGWQAGFITSDMEFPKILRLSPKQRIPIYNGKIECRLFVFDIVAGSNRK